MLPGAVLAQAVEAGRTEALYWEMSAIAESRGLEAANEYFYSLSPEDQAAVSEAVLTSVPAEEVMTIEQLSPESFGLTADLAAGAGNLAVSTRIFSRQTCIDITIAPNGVVMAPGLPL